MKYEKPKINISQVATKIFENKIKPMPRLIKRASGILKNSWINFDHISWKCNKAYLNIHTKKYTKQQGVDNYWPWNGGRPCEPADDGGEFKPLLRSGIGWMVWHVNPRRWLMPWQLDLVSSGIPPNILGVKICFWWITTSWLVEQFSFLFF